MGQLYEIFSVDEETPVQYVGVYTMHWQPEWGEPEVMFREADDWLERHDDEVREEERARCVKECDALSQKWFGDRRHSWGMAAGECAAKLEEAAAIRTQEATE